MHRDAPEGAVLTVEAPGASLLIRAGAVVVLVLASLLVSPGPAQAAPSLPEGFVLQTMPSGQEGDFLVDFSFAPDGSYFTAGKNGTIAWVSADGRARTLATLDVVTVQDLGLSGLAVAHDYATSGVVYVARTLAIDGRWTMRLSAFRVTGAPEPTALADERVIWDLPADADVHAMTGLVAAPDGTLWVSIGDAADFRVVDPLALRALDPSTGYGKLLHVLPDGQGVPTNPFYDPADPASWSSRVYASGFRSPFRLSLDPATGAPILGDVGWNTWEEVNHVRPGANYGWPCWEGDTQTPAYRDLAGCQGVGNTAPLWTYVHGVEGTSVTGGIVYTGSSYPEEYQGAYFFGDFTSQRIYTLRYGTQGEIVRAPEADGFGSGIGTPVKFEAGPNGDVVYADLGGAVLNRLVYVPGNRAPTAVAVLSTDPSAPTTVTFDAGRSSDLDGDPLSYRWEFGDGTEGEGVSVQHAYAAPGTTPVTAQLTVTDARGAAATTTFTVVPANRVPVIDLVSPPEDRRFAVGELVEATARATDAEDGELPVTWRVTLVHCSGGYCHSHPGESQDGSAYARPFVDHGGETRLEVTASAVDSSGVTASRTFVAEPRTRTLALSSSTPAVLAINGIERTSATITVGARVSLTAPPLAADGVATFEGWNDGQPRERLLVMPDADVVIGATYLTPIDRRYDAEPEIRSVLGDPVGAEVADGAVRYREYSGGRMYWSAEAGARVIYGDILRAYLAAGAHAALGEPLTDELGTPDGIGRFNHFDGASVYWTPRTGAHQVLGAIRAHWAALGWETSYLGYPTSDEYAVPGGRRSDFENGSITWDAATGRVVDSPS